MNTPSPTIFPLTYNGLIDGLTNGTYWNLDGARTLTWALADFGPYQWQNLSTIQPDIAAAYTSYQPYINLRFSYTGHYTDPQTAPADLVLSGDGSGLFFSSNNILAEGFFPNSALDLQLEPALVSGKYPTAPGDIWFNLNSEINFQSSYAPGSGAFATALHEIGHTLGLKHPFDNGGTGRPTFQGMGISAFDVDWFTVMSYNDTYSYSAPLWHPATPMIGDVIALQYIYGANLNTNAGDTTHTIVNDNVFQTIFDPSGSNTLNASSSSHGWNIDLAVVPAGTLAFVPWDVGYAAPIENLSVPTSLYWLYGTFHTVIGSPQSDVIVGSPVSDTINGGGGNDNINGMGGIDTAVFSGTPSQYTIAHNADGSVTLSGPDGVDTLTSIERLQIGSYKIAIDVNGDGGEAYRLYQAAFDRTPDQAGVGYWMSVLDNGTSLTAVAQSFVNSPEFSSKYGPLDTNQFVTQLYENVLHRAPDLGGLTYWANLLAAGAIGRADTLAQFSESQENQADVIGVIQNGFVYT